jgi:drug/metabolite transporter (DMT)-like permease
LIAFIGEAAALAVSVCWSVSSTFFTRAGQLVGSVIVNRIRLLVAIIFLVLAHLALGVPLPSQVEPYRWVWLSISGVIGLVLGDSFLFQALVLIGARLSMLMMSMAPIIASIFGWLLLSERLSWGQIAGILITVSGIGVVIMESNGEKRLQPKDFRQHLNGILFGLGGATGQALGLITAKKGMAGNFPALTGTLIRMIAATSTLWVITILIGKARTTLQTINKTRKSLLFITIGALAGPVVGVTFSLIAIQHTSVGVASTLMALPPVIMLPVGYLVFKERFGWLAILGTFLAVGGVALLFLV